jgi:golgin subfamily A member 4
VTTLLSVESEETVWSGSVDKRIVVWSLKTLKPLRTLCAHAAPVRCLSLGFQGIFSGADDKLVILWTIDGLKRKKTLEVQHKVRALCAYENDLWLSANESIVVYDWKTGMVRAMETAHPGGTSILAHLGNRVWSSGKDKRVLLWAKGGKFMHEQRQVMPFQSNCFLWPDHSKSVIWCAAANGDVILVDHQETVHTDIIGHEKPATFVCAAQSGQIWSGSLDGTIRIWSPSNEEVLDFISTLKTGQHVALLPVFRQLQHQLPEELTSSGTGTGTKLLTVSPSKHAVTAAWLNSWKDFIAVFGQFLAQSTQALRLEPGSVEEGAEQMLRKEFENAVDDNDATASSPPFVQTKQLFQALLFRMDELVTLSSPVKTVMGQQGRNVHFGGDGTSRGGEEEDTTSAAPLEDHPLTVREVNMERDRLRAEVNKLRAALEEKQDAFANLEDMYENMASTMPKAEDISILKDALLEAQEKIEENATKAANREKEIETLHQVCNRQKSSLQSMERDLGLAGKSSSLVESLRSQLSDSREQEENLREVLEARKVSTAALESEMGTLNKLYEDAQSSIAQLEAQTRQAEEMLQEKSAELETAIQERDTSPKILQLQEECAILGKNREVSQTLIQNLQMQCSETATQLKQVQKQFVEVRDERDELKGLYEGAKDSLEAQGQEIIRLHDELEEKTARCQTLDEELSLGDSDLSRLKEVNSQTAARAQALKTDRDKWEEEAQAAKSALKDKIAAHDSLQQALKQVELELVVGKELLASEEESAREWRQKYEAAQAELDEKSETYNSLVESLQDAQEEIRNSQTSAEANTSSLADLHAELEKSSQKTSELQEITDLKDKHLANMEEEVAALRSQAADSSAHLSELEQQLTTRESDMTTLVAEKEAILQQIQEEKEIQHREAEKYEFKITALQAAVNSTESQVAELQEQLQGLRDQLAKTEDDLRAKTVATSELEEQLEREKKGMDLQKETIRDREAHIEVLLAEKETLQQQAESKLSAEAAVAALQEALASKETEVAELKQQEQGLRDQLASVENEMNAMSSEANELEEQLETLKSELAISASVTPLTANSPQGGSPVPGLVPGDNASDRTLATVNEELLQKNEEQGAKIGELIEERDRLQCSLQELKQKHATAVAEKDGSAATVAGLEQLIADLKGQLAEEQSQATVLQEKSDALENSTSELGDLNLQLQELQDSNASLNSLVSSLKEQLKASSDKVETVQMEASSAREEAQSSEFAKQVLLEAHEHERTENKLVISGLESTISSLASKHEALQKECNRQEMSLEDLGQKVNSLSIENESLNEEINLHNMEKNASQMNKTLKDDKVTQLQDQIRLLQEDIRRKSSVNTTLHQALLKAEEETKHLSGLVRQRSDAMKEALATVHSELEGKKNALNEVCHQRDELMGKLQAMEIAHEKLDGAHQHLLRRVDHLTADNQLLQNNYEQAMEDMANRKDQIDGLYVANERLLLKMKHYQDEGRGKEAQAKEARSDFLKMQQELASSTGVIKARESERDAAKKSTTEALASLRQEQMLRRNAEAELRELQGQFDQELKRQRERSGSVISEQSPAQMKASQLAQQMIDAANKRAAGTQLELDQLKEERKTLISAMKEWSSTSQQKKQEADRARPQDIVDNLVSIIESRRSSVAGNRQSLDTPSRRSSSSSVGSARTPYKRTPSKAEASGELDENEKKYFLYVVGRRKVKYPPAVVDQWLQKWTAGRKNPNQQPPFTASTLPAFLDACEEEEARADGASQDVEADTGADLNLSWSLAN